MSEVRETTISVNAEEKIGLPSYSNVTIGATVTKTFVGEVNEKEALQEVADLVESFVAEERKSVLAGLQGS